MRVFKAYTSQFFFYFCRSVGFRDRWSVPNFSLHVRDLAAPLIGKKDANLSGRLYDKTHSDSAKRQLKGCHLSELNFSSGRAYGDGTKVTERAENRRFSQIHPFSWKVKQLKGRKLQISQKTEDFRTKPHETADWAPSP